MMNSFILRCEDVTYHSYKLCDCTMHWFNLTSVFTVEDSGQNEVHHESMLKSGPLIKLKGNYIKVVNKIKHIIASKQFEIEDLIEKLCLAHESYAFSTDNTVTKVATINELFFHINKYCNIYDYELLREFLVSLDECDEAVKLLDDFTEELHHSVLKELDLMSESKDQLKPKIPINGTCTLRIKYTGDKCTLSTKNMVQRIIYESLKLHKQSIVFIGLEEGCIVFVYQISANVKSYILQNKITPDGIRLLASHDIKCLIVDGTEIPIPLEFIFKTQVSILPVCLSTCIKHIPRFVHRKLDQNVIICMNISCCVAVPNRIIPYN